MSTPGVRVINPDPYKLQNLVNISKFPGDLIYKKKNTIHIIPKNLANSQSLYKNIKNKLVTIYPNSQFNFTIDGNIGKIRVASNGYGSIHIRLPKKSIPSVLKPGEAFELYFHSILLDGITHIKEITEEFSDIPSSILNMYVNLTLLIKSGNKSITIGNIKSADKVGQLNAKPDIIIYRKIGNPVKISLKQSNFFSWSSADTYDNRFSNRVKAILDSAIKNNIVTLGVDNKIIFPSGIKGLIYPSNLREVQKYAYGENNDKVDYIIINSNLSNFDSDTNIIYLNAEKIFKADNNSDINEIRNDMYLNIYSSSGSSSALSPYKNVRVRYVNKNHAYNAIDGSKYIDMSSMINI